MKVDLSKNSIFTDSSLSFKKRCTYIYGPNGTGKSTLANEIRNQQKDLFDVRVFQGFDNVIGDNKRLNAIVLGENNTVIQQQINDLDDEIKKVKSEIDRIQLTLKEPQSSKKSNYWTRKDNAEKECKKIHLSLESLFSNFASSIKNLSNSQIAEPSYNRTKFQKEITHAELLEENEYNALKDTVNTELKTAKNIMFPKIDSKNLLKVVNELLSRTVEEKILIKRLEGNSEKQNFARIGLKIHKQGDVCSFCGNIIKTDEYNELKSYFSADEVKLFSKELEDNLNNLKHLKKETENITINIEDFYPSNIKAIQNLQNDLDNLKNEYSLFFDTLIKSIDEKQKYLFESLNAVVCNIPNTFEKIQIAYNDILITNNSNDIDEIKKKAKTKLRFHEIKRLLMNSDYEIILGKLEAKEDEKKRCTEEYDIEKNKIYGECGLEESLNRLEKRKQLLQSQTTSETLLTEHINHKLGNMISFKLEHCEDSENNGYYNILNPKTKEMRDITQLSTGEKNIIAFLYFIEKLNEVKETLSYKSKIIVFDDPMNSNDDGMQYLIMEEISKLIHRLGINDKFILMTHNKHFYLNVTYGLKGKYKDNTFIHLQSVNGCTNVIPILSEEDDFKNSYDSLWKEVILLYKYESASAELLLNPIRRIIETYTKFNSMSLNKFYENVSGARKLFNVNSHSIDDLTAELNGKTKEDILILLRRCFSENNAIDHFDAHCDIKLKILQSDE